MNIYQKLVEVRKSVTYLQKETKGHQYNYVSSSQVLTALREKMDELGLLLVPKVLDTNVLTEMVEAKDKDGNVFKKTTTYFTELHMEFVWVNADKPDEIIVCPWYGQGVDIAGEKGVGKAMTYAEKYFLLKMFNIATDKDDPDSMQNKHDGNGKTKQAPVTTNKVDKETLANIADRGEQAGVNTAEIKKMMKEMFNVSHGLDMTVEQAAELDAKLIERLEGVNA